MAVPVYSYAFGPAISDAGTRTPYTDLANLVLTSSPRSLPARFCRMRWRRLDALLWVGCRHMGRRSFLQIDDAVQIVVTNSKFAGTVPGGMLYRKWPAVSGSVDIAPWMAPGTNRIVIAHVVRSP